MIGWGPRQYAPIHDHPVGGCLGKVVRGPGLIETHYRKTKQSLHGGGRDIQSVLSNKMMISDKTKVYRCVQNTGEKNSHGCQLKNETFALITELKTYETTTENLQVTHQRGYDHMHSVMNPHNETTLTLHHYYGDYHISFWIEVEQPNFL